MDFGIDNSILLPERVISIDANVKTHSYANNVMEFHAMKLVRKNKCDCARIHLAIIVDVYETETDFHCRWNASILNRLTQKRQRKTPCKTTFSGFYIKLSVSSESHLT